MNNFMGKCQWCGRRVIGVMADAQLEAESGS